MVKKEQRTTNQQGLTIRTHEVTYEIFDERGDLFDSGGKVFSSLSQAKKYANNIKIKTDKKKQIFIKILDVRTNQLVDRMKKKSGNRNYMRGN